VRWGIDELIDALMIEKNGDAARREKNGCTVLECRGARIVDLVALASVQLHKERLERLARHQRLEGFLEMLGGHGLSLSCDLGW